jgi:hypothetical protein
VSLASKIVWPLRQSTSIYIYFYWNIALPRASDFTLLVDKGIRWLKYWCIIQWDAVYKSNITLPRASAFTLLVDKGIRWLMYWCMIQWDDVYSNITLPRASAFTLLVDKGIRWLKDRCVIQWDEVYSSITLPWSRRQALLPFWWTKEYIGSNDEVKWYRRWGNYNKIERLNTCRIQQASFGIIRCKYVCTCIWCVSMRWIHTFASYFAFQTNQNALTSSILSQNSGIVIAERQINRSVFQCQFYYHLEVINRPDWASDSGIGFQ